MSWAACQSLTKGGCRTRCFLMGRTRLPLAGCSWMIDFQTRLTIKAQLPPQAGAERLRLVRTGTKGMQQDSVNYADLPACLEGLEWRAEAKSISWMNEHNWFGQTLSWGGWLPPPGQPFAFLNCNYRVSAKWTLHCQKLPAQSPGIKTAFQPFLLLTGKWSFAKTRSSCMHTNRNKCVSLQIFHHQNHCVLKLSLLRFPAS